MQEEDSLQGATKRRQLFTDFDTRDIYHQKNLDNNTSHGMLTMNSYTQQVIENSIVHDEDEFPDISKVQKQFKETKSENVNLQETSLTTNEQRLKESQMKDQRTESNILVLSKNLRFDETPPSNERMYGINVYVSNHNDGESLNNCQIKGNTFNFAKSVQNYSGHLVQSPEKIAEVDEDSQKTRKIQKKQQFIEVWSRLGSVMFNVKKFLKILRSQCSYFKYKVLMEHRTLHIIGDKSFFNKGDYKSEDIILFNEEEDKTCIQKLSEPMSPDDLIVLIWETYLLCILSFESFIIPFKSCFKYDMSELSGLFVLLPVISYTIEMLFNLNKGYFDQGNLISKRMLITRKYLQKQFFVDIACLVSSYFYQNFQNIEILNILFIVVRISQVQRLISKLDDSYQLQFRYPESSELSKLMLTIIYIAHLTGCGFHYVGMYISTENDNWLERYKIYTATVFERYINSLYYAFITMVTVGYGDIVPISNQEKIYVIFMTLISCCVFAYSVNTIGSIFRDLSKKSFNFKKINVKLQRRILRALEYAEQQEQRGSQQGETILRKIQAHLQNEIKQDFFGKILLNHKIFQLNFSKNFLKQLSLKMVEKLLARDDILFSQGELDENYYIVLSGSLEVFIMTQEYVTLGNIFPGTGVGQRGFFTGIPRLLYAKSSEITRVVCISRSSFLETIKNYPLDYERFCSIKDQIMQEDKEFDIKCLACSQFTHGILDCPVINPKEDLKNKLRQSLLSKKRNGIVMMRRYVERKRHKKYNVFKNKTLICDKLKKLRIDVTGVLGDLQKRTPSELEIKDYMELYNSLNDFEFYIRLPSIKMVKSDYNEHIFDLVVNNSDDQIVEDLPLMEYIQDFLKMNGTNCDDKESTDFNQNTEIFISNNIVNNEPSIANENNCGNINTSQSHEMQGFRKDHSVLDLQTNQLLSQAANSQNPNLKKSKTQSSLAVVKSMNQKKQISIDLDGEAGKEQQQVLAQPILITNSATTEIYFQSLEKKSNPSPFEQEILRQYKHNISSSQKFQKQPSKSIQNNDNAKQTTGYIVTDFDNQHEYRDPSESPLHYRKQNILVQAQSMKSALVNQYAGEVTSQNGNSNFISRSNRRKSTKQVQINQNENQIITQLQRINSSASNNVASYNSSEQLDLKNSIKVHHMKLNNNSTGEKGEKTSNHTMQSVNVNTQQTTQNNSIYSKGNQSNRQQERPDAYQQNSFKLIKQPSSNLINFNLKGRPSNMLCPEELNNVAKTLVKERSKTNNDEIFWSIIDFEVQKTFLRYFPQNNIENVISKYSLIQERKAKKQKSVRDTYLNKQKTFQFLSKCYYNSNTPHRRRGGAEKSYLASIYNNASLSQLNKNNKRERARSRQKDQESNVLASSKQRSSSDLGKLTDFIAQDVSII